MESFTDKYKPKRIQDLVLPAQHSLDASLAFCSSPYASAWLLHGRPGLGKTSLANIMGEIAGPDVSIDVVRNLAASFTAGSLFGQFSTVIINESDVMPRAASSTSWTGSRSTKRSWSAPPTTTWNLLKIALLAESSPSFLARKASLNPRVIDYCTSLPWKAFPSLAHLSRPYCETGKK
jgi:hypothetical protein